MLDVVLKINAWYVCYCVLCIYNLDLWYLTKAVCFPHQSMFMEQPPEEPADLPGQEASAELPAYK